MELVSCPPGAEGVDSESFSSSPEPGRLAVGAGNKGQGTRDKGHLHHAPSGHDLHNFLASFQSYKPLNVYKFSLISKVAL